MKMTNRKICIGSIYTSRKLGLILKKKIETIFVCCLHSLLKNLNWCFFNKKILLKGNPVMGSI